MKKFINFRPITYFLFALISGLLCSFALTVENVLLFWIAVSCALCLIVITVIFGLVKTRRMAFYLAALFAIFFAVGFSSARIKASSFLNYDIPEQNYVISGRVDEFSEKDGDVRLLLSNVKFDGAYASQSPYKVLLTVTDGQGFEVGDEIICYAKPKSVGIVYNSAFNSYYIANGVRFLATTSATKVTVVQNSPNIFEKVNRVFRDTLKSGLNEEEFATAYALLCGNDGYMGESTLEAFRNAGIAHVFAVSGLHIGFLASLLQFVLSKLKVNSRIKTAIIIFVLFFYSGVCSFSSSSVRASIMVSVALLSKESGKKYDALSSISLAAIIILVLSPYEIFEVGFELSFVVSAGIIVFARSVSKLFGFLPEKISSSIGTVVAAQLFALPISLLRFGSVSIVSVLTNFVFIPVVGVIYTCLFSFTVVSAIFGAGGVLLFPMNYVLRFSNAVAKAVGVELFVFSTASLGIFTLFYYVAALIISPLCFLKRSAKAVLSVIFIVFTLGGSVLSVKQKEKGLELRIYSSYDMCCSLFTHDKSNTLVLSHFGDRFYARGIRSLLSESGVDEIENLIILDTDNDDIQNALSVISRISCVNNLYAYGDYLTFKTIEKCFENLKVFDLEKVSEFSFGKANVSINYGCEAYVVFGDFAVSVFSELSFEREKVLLAQKRIDADLVVSVDESEIISSIVGKDKYVCFKGETGYRNAYHEGFLLFEAR